jgi:dTDP-4-amino-4,6-dideoxy-D-galactose acyltransferase
MQPQSPAATKAEFSKLSCEFLEWDSLFFGCRIGSVRARQLSTPALLEIDRWCEAQRIDCLYFLADFDNPETIRLAEKNFFRLVDVRLTLRLTFSSLPDLPPAVGGIRLSQSRDVPVLRRIARSSHASSRFYFDPYFPRDRCDALYETWIEKSCSGDADVVFVPELEGEPAGYISCHLKPDQAGLIGLVGLAPEARGRDLGVELVREALRWFRTKNVTQVAVVTQGRNVAAQRIYQRCGFYTQSLQLWYHRWSSQQRRGQ